MLKTLQRQLLCPPSPEAAAWPGAAGEGSKLPPLPGATAKALQLNPLVDTSLKLDTSTLKLDTSLQGSWASPGSVTLPEREVFERIMEHENRTIEILLLLHQTLDDDTNATVSTEDDRKMATWQQLLREQNAIDELVNVICLPLEMRLIEFGNSKSNPELCYIINTAHSVLQLLCSRNCKNQFALFQSGSRILSVIGESASQPLDNVAATLLTNNFVRTNLALYWDNRSLLMKIPADRVRACGTMIRRHKQPIYLKFLNALCTTLHKDGQPLTATLTVLPFFLISR